MLSPQPQAACFHRHFNFFCSEGTVLAGWSLFYYFFFLFNFCSMLRSYLDHHSARQNAPPLCSRIFKQAYMWLFSSAAFPRFFVRCAHRAGNSQFSLIFLLWVAFNYSLRLCPFVSTSKHAHRNSYHCLYLCPSFFTSQSRENRPSS